jgi:hypothetical protein
MPPYRPGILYLAGFLDGGAPYGFDILHSLRSMEYKK